MHIKWHGTKSRKTPRSKLSEHVGKQLASLRQRDQLTMREVHERTGISVAFICDVENGNACPTLDTLWKFAKCFGVPMQRFWKGFPTDLDNEDE